jgi:peptidoglycan hydrolase-like protein with peptidoglycan-binding domain
MANLKQGSSGSDVKKLQQTLIEKGYNVGGTGADGVFGKNTLAAVKKYQKDNSLAVDGIAGKNTLGSLYSAGSQKTTGTGNGGKVKDKPVAPAAGAPAAGEAGADDAPAAPIAPVTSPAGFTYGDFSYDPYAKSDIVLEAESMLQQWQANQPGSYKPVWQDEADAYLSQYQNRGPFSYDFNSDALYNQYKDQYIQQGQMAMMDTMGQASAMTGGYGNSYAQTVGQQAYNQQLSQLNEIMPELYQMAYDRYGKEGQEMLDMYNLYMNREAMEYGKHQDTVDNWYREMARLTNNANTLYERDYEDYLLGYNTSLNEYNTDRSEAFTSNENQKGRDFTQSENDKDRAEKEKANAKSDLINLITGTGYKPTDSELKAAGLTREQANSYVKAYSDSQTNPGTKDPKYTVLDYEEMQKWEKKFETADSIQALEKAGDQMEQAGVDPEVVATWVSWYIDKFKDEEPKKTPADQIKSGGGAGGVYYMEHL